MAEENLNKNTIKEYLKDQSSMANQNLAMVQPYVPPSFMEFASNFLILSHHEWECLLKRYQNYNFLSFCTFIMFHGFFLSAMYTLNAFFPN